MADKHRVQSNALLKLYTVGPDRLGALNWEWDIHLQCEALAASLLQARGQCQQGLSTTTPLRPRGSVYSCTCPLTRLACEALFFTKDPFFWKLPILFMLVRDSDRLLDSPTMEGAGPPSLGFTEMMSPSLSPIC